MARCFSYLKRLIQERKGWRKAGNNHASTYPVYPGDGEVLVSPPGKTSEKTGHSYRQKLPPLLRPYRALRILPAIHESSTGEPGPPPLSDDWQVIPLNWLIGLEEEY